MSEPKSTIGGPSEQRQTPAKNEGENDSTQEAHSCPEGYPRAAALLNVDGHFAMFREFGHIQMRLLLHKQYHLMELEKELIWNDKKPRNPEERVLNSERMREEDDMRRRKDRTYHGLMQELEKTFREYSDLMVAVRQVKSFGRPSKRDFVKVNEELKENSSQPRKDETWLFSSDGTYKREEWLNKLNYAQDLVVVAPVSKDPDPLATVFGDWRPNFSFLKRCCCYGGSCCCEDSCCDNFLRRKSDDQSGFGKYWKPTISSRARDHTLVTGFDALSIAVLLVLPIALCYIILIRTDGNKAYGICIAVIFAFMLIFATCMPALGSDPTRNEILAATSGYCAVLVVFLGGLSQ